MQKINSATSRNFQQEITSSYQLAPFLNWIALQCLKPMHRFSQWSVHALQTPIKPGEFGNAHTREFEIFSRVLTVAACITLCPVQLTGMLLSGMIDTVTDYVASKNFTRLCGIEEITGNISESFMTLNTCMLWGGLPILFGGVRPFPERIDRVISLILEKKPDIVVMQEVCFEAGLTFWDKLKTQYAHGFTRIGPMPFLALDTGLFIASKHAIVKEPVFVSLPTNKLIKRGFFYFETNLNAVFVTHLEAGEEEEDEKMRKNQLELIIEQMQKIVGKPALLLGDLNIHKADTTIDEYTTSGIDKHFDNFYQEPISEKTATCTNQLTAIATGKSASSTVWEHIDYVLQLKDSSKQKLAIEIIPTYDLKNPDKSISDHNALLAKKHI